MRVGFLHRTPLTPIAPSPGSVSVVLGLKVYPEIVEIARACRAFQVGRAASALVPAALRVRPPGRVGSYLPAPARQVVARSTPTAASAERSADLRAMTEL